MCGLIVDQGPSAALVYGSCQDSCLHAVCSQASQAHNTSVECNFHCVLLVSQ